MVFFSSLSAWAEALPGVGELLYTMLGSRLFVHAAAISHPRLSNAIAAIIPCEITQ